MKSKIHYVDGKLSLPKEVEFGDEVIIISHGKVVGITDIYAIGRGDSVMIKQTDILKGKIENVFTKKIGENGLLSKKGIYEIYYYHPLSCQYLGIEYKSYSTPEDIFDLEVNEILAFGSNDEGLHYGGAAKIAFENFGAKWGIGEGMQGQTYAVPVLEVMNENMHTIPEIKLIQKICKFLEFVKLNPELTFYLTKIGCGIAGYPVKYMNLIFNKSLKEAFDSKLPNNLIIPKEFKKI